MTVDPSVDQSTGTLRFGDMLLSRLAPPKLMKAAAVVSQTLHPAFDRISMESRSSCVLSSLTVRDFLRRIGFGGAKIAPVVFTIRAEQAGRELHSLSIGDPSETTNDLPGHWYGHMIAVLPDEGFLLDTTLYQATRPQWSELPGMMTMPLRSEDQRLFGLRTLSDFGASFGERSVSGVWLDQPNNRRWRSAPDASRRRRSPVVDEMVSRFGSWTAS